MMDHYTRDDELPEVLSIMEHGISWFLAVLPDQLREGYRQRYYELVDMYAPDEASKKMVKDWLDKATVVTKHN
jgi:hypothetical protein